jgi:hypothetical protein
MSGRFGLTNLAIVTDQIRTVRANSYCGHLRWRKHPDVLVGHEFTTVLTLGHREYLLEHHHIAIGTYQQSSGNGGVVTGKSKESARNAHPSTADG